MGTEERPRERPASVRALPLPTSLCGATADLWQEKKIKERKRRDHALKKVRLVKNIEQREIALQAASPATFELSDRPANEADEAAVLGRLLRETAEAADPRNYGTVEDGIAAEKAHLDDLEHANQCCVCSDDWLDSPGEELVTLKCEGKGLHKLCWGCLKSMQKYVRDHPECGELVRYTEPWRDGMARAVVKKGIACNCPLCRKPFLSVWSSSAHRMVCAMANRAWGA